MSSDYEDLSLGEMFRQESDTRTTAMTAGLLRLEQEGPTPAVLEELMRHAHSLKGAASVVERSAAVEVAHAMEDCFTAAQRGRAVLPPARIDQLLRGVDLLNRLAAVADDDYPRWSTEHRLEIDLFLQSLNAPSPLSAPVPAPALPEPAPPAPEGSAPPGEPLPAPGLPPAPAPIPLPAHGFKPPVQPARALRVAADNLNRLLGLAGESVVASRWLDTFSHEILRLKRQHGVLAASLSSLREILAGEAIGERATAQLVEVQAQAAECREELAARIEAIDAFDRRCFALSKRLYQEVLDCRMRPLADGTQGLARLVRDAARTLEKRARLEIVGEETPVDREILERIEAPLGHLLRNAVDHGLESPALRERAGKPPEGAVRLEARHSAGMLLIEVSDDGAGLDAASLREAVVRKGLTTPELAATLSEAELYAFLFLPGFTMKSTVTQISGRGVGLDAVHSVVKEVGGTVRVTSVPGQGTHFVLQLPLTLSVLRTLLVEVAGEPYAFPLARLSSARRVPRAEVESIEGRQHFRLGEQQVGLVTARQALGLPSAPEAGEALAVLVLGEKASRFGLVVDRLLGEHELVVRPLESRLGKLQNIAAAALMPDQSPVLIIDVDDLLRSIEVLISGGRLAPLSGAGAAAAERRQKRVLVVDDSLTVRELERKLIEGRGYQVEIAVDGMDGWNAVRTGRYDLVVTDVDMPRLDGIELVSLIKKDPRLQQLPVMIVSYKDREEDRRRGLEAGADYYLTKGSFHDETLLQALEDLIGGAAE